MNAYLLIAIQSADYGNQFVCSTRDEHSSEIIFGSMRHENEVGVHDGDDELLLVSMMNNAGLKSSFPELATADGLVIRHKHNDLTDCCILLGKVFAMAAVLSPDAGVIRPERTYIQRVVKAWLGQHRYKTEQLASWGESCAVTGVTNRVLLRASHAKPWAVANDAERLDSDDGLPLVAHPDALFDAGLISFASDGTMMPSPQLEDDVVQLYGWLSGLSLRLVPTNKQDVYLAYHWNEVFRG